MNLDELLPYELEELLDEILYILKINKFETKINSKIVAKNNSIKSCPHCQSNNFSKNGKNNGVQRYICKECKKTFGATNNTFIYSSKIPYNTWIKFIECELLHLSLQQTADIINISKTTCFAMRHKLYGALTLYCSKVKLTSSIKIDALHMSLNFKGTKPNNMIRLSKIKGNTSEFRGVSHRKVCVLTAIDDNDNMFMKIVGMGPETNDMVLSTINYFSFNDNHNCKLISDMKQSYSKLAIQINLNHDQVKSGTYKSTNGNHLAELNQLHSEFKTLISRYKGVCTRHLQGYLDFFCFTKKAKYTIKLNRSKIIHSLKSAINETFSIYRNDISLKEYPVNLENVYPGKYRIMQLKKLDSQHLC